MGALVSQRPRPPRLAGGLAGLALALAAGQAGAQPLARQGSLGIQFGDQSAFPSAPGVLVTRLVEASAAQKADIRPDDRIVAVDGAPVATTPAFRSLVQPRREGETLRLQVARGDTLIDKVVTLAGRPREAAAGLDVVYDSVRVDGARRRTILTKPKAAGRHPAVLFLTGVGCGSQDSLPADNPIAQLLYGLTRKGFVTMRVEKSGVGDSEGVACTSPLADLEAEVRGYRAGLAALKDDASVASDKIFLVGLSMGGVVAPLVAKDQAVAGIVVAETVGRSWFEYELDNMRRQLGMRGVAPDEVERLVRAKEACNTRLYRDRQTPDEVARAAPHCARLPIQPPAPYTYMRQVADLNIASEWKTVRAPTLIVYGESDFLTSLEEHQYLASAINAFNPGQASVLQIEQMDHFLAKAASQAESMRRTNDPNSRDEFQAAMLDRTAEWLTRRVAGG